MKCAGCGKEVGETSSFPQPSAPKGDFCDDCAESIIDRLIKEGNWESW